MKKKLVIIFIMIIFIQYSFADEIIGKHLFVSDKGECKADSFLGIGVNYEDLINNKTDWKLAETRNFIILQTPWGNCETNNPGQLDHKSCCEILGFDFVNYTKIPYETSDYILTGSSYKCFSQEGKSNWGSGTFRGVMINKESNSCSSLIDFVLISRNETSRGYVSAGRDDCYISDSNWTEYIASKYETRVFLGDKVCRNFIANNEESVKECCRELGLTYVGDTQTNGFKTENYSLYFSIFLIILTILIIFYIIRNKNSFTIKKYI